jgi:thioredoxin reductase
MQDVVVIGGSFAGLSAAIQLGRARRNVTVLDTSSPRNRFASHAHSIIGHDNKPPHEILREAREQMKPYTTIKFAQLRATEVSGEKDNFVVTTEDGNKISTRRVILAHGVTDIMPEHIEGFAECWGRSVLHCPYCHGFEVADQALGVLYFHPMLSPHVVAMLCDFSKNLTLFADGHTLAPEFREKLDRKGVKVFEPKLSKFVHSGGQMSHVVLEDGSQVELTALFAHPRQRPSAEFYRQLNVNTSEMPLGTIIQIGDNYETSVPGVYAIGDIASMKQSAVLAMAAGNMAGVMCHHSILDF